jgi:hypothetical protein
MEHEQPLASEQPRRSGIGRVPLIVALFCVCALALGIWVKDQQQTSAFDAERAQMKATLDQSASQSKAQIQELTQRMDALLAAQARAQAARTTPTRRAAVKTRRRPLVANDPRVDKLQGQLNDTQQELARTKEDMAKTRDELNGSIASTRDDLSKTRDDLNKTRDDFNGRLNSTRDDLNGSIARTHDEVVALRKRGESNVYEFQLDRSKQFHRVGPLSVALRSASPKHKTYDMAMIVEDSQLTKKHVNLYEPVWITLSDRAQPVELVVNHIGKDQISGYVSEPKYKKSELASAATEKPAPAPQLETR